MLDKIEEDSEFFDRILWSDESSAKRDGFLNLHNLHSWQLTNPHLIPPNRRGISDAVIETSGRMCGVVSLNPECGNGDFSSVVDESNRARVPGLGSIPETGQDVSNL
ncbi:Uncharacterized protein OBRU01_22990 [Operophtera brumata]|uniref:Uncharacterized protein n=1 Tax=Operophtera brumata TaxID=104452 RepID=A0A0L7KQB9_OPEBR|nr:Uncharacterized protein OBRU01_22990 [Operophtera brumata]